MKNPSILLSVVIPAYNYASTLPRAFASVVNQLTDSRELIVIDDGSTDDTEAVIAQLASEVPASVIGRVRFIRKQNGGLSSVRNLGIREALGSFIVFLDADDELLPDALQKLESHIAKYPQARMVIGGHISVWADGRRRQHLPGLLPRTALERVRAYLLEKSVVLCNGACAMHKEVFSRGDYPESFRSAEDIPVFAQTLAHYSCTTVQEPMALIHKHDDSLRHQFNHARAVGLQLVDEIFSTQRLGADFQFLESEYSIQRSLSLFRSAFLAEDYEAAKDFFRTAVKKDWRVIGKLSYSRKALRLWLRS